MAEVTGIKSVVGMLKALANGEVVNVDGVTVPGVGPKPKVTVVTGYDTAYAVYVHENIEMKWKGKPRRKPAKGNYWDPKGEAKFLEKPAREMANNGEFQRIIVAALQGGATLEEALLLAGLRLQRESQLRVPVDTGALKNSAFTVVE